MVTREQVKELREITGAGILDCKQALEEVKGDITYAVEVLRERGLAKAEKKTKREVRQGLVEAYIHTGGRIGSMVEVNCETDFVAQTDDFRELGLLPIPPSLEAMTSPRRWIPARPAFSTSPSLRTPERPLGTSSSKR